jgi:hypothetical protein
MERSSNILSTYPTDLDAHLLHINCIIANPYHNVNNHELFFICLTTSMLKNLMRPIFCIMEKIFT